MAKKRRKKKGKPIGKIELAAAIIGLLNGLVNLAIALIALLGR